MKTAFIKDDIINIYYKGILDAQKMRSIFGIENEPTIIEIKKNPIKKGYDVFYEEKKIKKPLNKKPSKKNNFKFIEL